MGAKALFTHRTKVHCGRHGTEEQGVTSGELTGLWMTRSTRACGSGKGADEESIYHPRNL